MLLTIQVKVLLAEASQRAIQKATEAIQDRELPATFILGERYVEAMRQMASSENAKIVLVPADIPTAIRGIMENRGTERFVHQPVAYDTR